jgi:hypothetical protein
MRRRVAGTVRPGAATCGEFVRTTPRTDVQGDKGTPRTEWKAKQPPPRRSNIE